MFILWIEISWLIILFVYIIMFKDDTIPYFNWVVVLWTINMVLVSFVTFGLWSIYSSPHIYLNNTWDQQIAHNLLECAHVQIPKWQERWSMIDTCIESATMYSITNGRFPYSIGRLVRDDAVPTAFVMPAVDSHSIFVTDFFQNLDIVQKALVLIHECAHIAFNAKDHAYRWEHKFMLLTEKQHNENADSFMDAVFYHCT